MEGLRRLFGSKAGVSVGEARRAAEDGAVLLDVREPAEWRAGHAPQAIHVPLHSLSQQVPSLPRNRTIVTVCRSGNRSAKAAHQLSRLGFSSLNMEGGMRAWAAAGLPVVTTTGAPGEVV